MLVVFRSRRSAHADRAGTAVAVKLADDRSPGPSPPCAAMPMGSRVPTDRSATRDVTRSSPSVTSQGYCRWSTPDVRDPRLSAPESLSARAIMPGARLTPSAARRAHRRACRALGRSPLLVVVATLAATSLSTGVVGPTSATPADAGGSITQVVSFTGTVAAGTAYAGQLAVTGDIGPVTYVTTAASAGVSVSGSGAVDSPTTAPVGVYSVSGTDSDGSGDSGSWAFTLRISPPSPIPVGSTPSGIAVTPSGSDAYVAN